MLFIVKNTVAKQFVCKFKRFVGVKLEDSWEQDTLQVLDLIGSVLEGKQVPQRFCPKDNSLWNLTWLF